MSTATASTASNAPTAPLVAVAFQDWFATLATGILMHPWSVRRSTPVAVKASVLAWDALFINGLIKRLRLVEETEDIGSTVEQAAQAHKSDLVTWLDDRRLEAIVQLTRRASEVFGHAVQRDVELRHDPEREPTDFAVIGITTTVDDRELLIAGEVQLIDFLLDSYPDVEDDFVVVCRRRRP